MHINLNVYNTGNSTGATGSTGAATGAGGAIITGAGLIDRAFTTLLHIGQPV
jgi:hypothetical protein